MSNGTYSEWLTALGQNESGNNYSFVSSAGYLGRYQFGEEALAKVGFYNGDNTSAIDFTGSWSSTAQALGVHDKASFLASSAAQDAAATAWFAAVDADINALDLGRYDGQTINGVVITTSGLVAGAHLVGVWGLKAYLESGGAVMPRDYYGTPISEYVARFGGYDIPFTLNDNGTASVTAPPPAAPAAPAALAVDPMSSVANLSYEFFTGRAPTAAGMDYLVSANGPNPNNLNSAYYQAFSLENRYINFAVDLGKVGEGAANFQSRYGGLSLFDATKQAYATIFGDTPSDAKTHAILDAGVAVGGQWINRADYFAKYGQDGIDGLGTKAAMVGWLLAEADKAQVGVYALANEAFLNDVAAHNAPLGVDLVGVYSQPGFVFHPG